MLYNDIVALFERLDKTTKRLEKTHILAELLKKTGPEDLPEVMMLCQGKIFPAWDDRKINVSEKLAIKAIQKATGASPGQVEEGWRRLGDLGDVAEELAKKRKQVSLSSRELTVRDVLADLRRLVDMEGAGSVDKRVSLIAEMLINATPTEAKYLIRTVIDNLRVGIGQSSVRDAILWAYGPLSIPYEPGAKDLALGPEERKAYEGISDKLQRACDITSDLGEVAKVLREKGAAGLDAFPLVVGRPVNVMLYQKAKDVAGAFEAVGRPAAFEFKYDGFRMQVHKDHAKVRIFTRRLEEVTAQFPELVPLLLERIVPKTCILEGEAVGIDPKTGKYLAFQTMSQRIRRKYDIEELAEKFPVELNLFDFLTVDGKDLLDTPFSERRRLLEKAVKQLPGKLVLSRQLVTGDDEEARAFYAGALAAGQEGAMAKNLEGPYKPGARVGFGVKIKPTMEPLDLVIVGAEYGEGKRSGGLTSFVLACRDGDRFLEIGRVSTGLKEIEEQGTSFAELTRLLKPLIEGKGVKEVKVRPEVVIEVGYEEIQKSPAYSSGYALRFPRFLRLRTDEKNAEDINTLDDVEMLYVQQRGREQA